MKKTYRLPLSIFFALLFLTASVWLLDRSTVPFWERSEYTQAITEKFGLVITGHNVPGSIYNANFFPVRIRSTWVFRGETDRWNIVLQPGERILDTPGHQVLYHVYRIDSSEEVEVVFTSPNGPVGPHYRNPFTLSFTTF